MKQHILIAGGGIGGMISALYLKKRDMMSPLSKKMNGLAGDLLLYVRKDIK